MTDDNGVPLSVFRTVEVAEGVTLTLGEPPSAQAMAMMKQIGPNRYQLKPAAGAEEIDVQLGVGDAVLMMEFIYAPSPDYAQLLIQFEAELGPPTSQHGQTATWEDAATRFHLVGSAGGSRSTLKNLAPTES